MAHTQDFVPSRDGWPAHLNGRKPRMDTHSGGEGKGLETAYRGLACRPREDAGAAYRR